MDQYLGMGSMFRIEQQGIIVIMSREDEQISYATARKSTQKYKVVFVGDQNVGKSSVINRFIKNTFDSSHNPTIGIDFVSKNMNVDGKAVRLQLWDTAGQERFRSLIPSYIRDSNAAFLIFDLSNEDTFTSLPTWIDFIRENRGEDALIYILGNKLDIQDRKVKESVANAKMLHFNLPYFEVSAKTGENLIESFEKMCRDMLEITENDYCFTAKPKAVNNEKRREKIREVKEPSSLKNVSRVVMNGKEGRYVREKNCC